MSDTLLKKHTATRHAKRPIAELAQRPPMGWNSWDCFGVTVTEDEVRQNAEFVAEHLSRFGWQYVVVDLAWAAPHATNSNYKKFGLEQHIDEYGRLIPDPVKFPSSAGGVGFRPLADFVHSLGLKFGIHIMRGMAWQAARARTPILGTSYTADLVADKQNRCPWFANMYGVRMTHPGGQAYYDSIVDLYASWSVDFIKADDMNSWDGDALYAPYRTDEIEALRAAIDRCGRDMVVSLSPGAAEPCNARHLARHANMWRISCDLWDDWEHLAKQFARCRRWAPYAKPGHWPDADMLPLGRLLRGEIGDSRTTRLSPDEQRTMMTLWCIFRSPLMFGGYLPQSDPETLALISNEEVLAVNQASSNHREVLFEPDQCSIWTAEAEVPGQQYVALFNLSERAAEVGIDFGTLGIDGAVFIVRDLWTRKTLGPASGKLTAKLRPHASALYRLAPAES